MTIERTKRGIRVTGWLATLGGQDVGDGAYDSEQVALEVAEARADVLGVEQKAGARYIDAFFPIEVILEYVDAEDTPMAQDERHNTRTPVEFIAHLLEVGSWYASAIELDQYRPNFANGEQLREEAERIVRQANREDLLNRGEAMMEDR